MTYDENRISDQIDGGLLHQKEIMDLLHKNISEITEMPAPLKNALQANGITTLNQVTGMNRHEIKMLKNFGKKRIELLKEFLSENNIQVVGW